MANRPLLDDFESLTLGSAAVVRDWAERHRPLASCHDVAAVLTAIPADPDGVLAALLEEVANGCGVAARVVLHAMVPKMMTMARRDPAASLEDYLAQLWLRIATYPLSARPRRIAANLALDTLKAVKAEQVALLVPTAAFGTDRSGHRPADDLSARRLLRAAVDLRLIDPATHATMINVYADGLPEAEVAASQRVTTTTVRRRCNRGIRVMAANATRLAEAV